MPHHDHHHHHDGDAGAHGWQDEVEAFRRQKDAFFAEDPHSPLPHHERHDFTGLSYFPPNPDLVFDVALEPADGEVLTIPTSDGDERRFVRAARVTVDVDGQDVSFVLLAREGEDGYFLPFRDATSGQSSYGAGRYLDLEDTDGRVHIDFNLAYNPSCAYDDAYSCPLPPPDNWVQVPILAGEKTYPRPSG